MEIAATIITGESPLTSVNPQGTTSVVMVHEHKSIHEKRKEEEEQLTQEHLKEKTLQSIVCIKMESQEKNFIPWK
eukprot:14801712-Ditylum_brightwellii.AAC.1